MKTKDSTKESTRSPLPDTVSASLEARLAPFTQDSQDAVRGSLEDLDVEASRAVTPHHERRQRLGLIRDLKLLFAALGAGNSVVPMGDNSHAARLLSRYAASLRSN